MKCGGCGEEAEPGHLCASVLAATLPMPGRTVAGGGAEPPTEPASFVASQEAKTRVAMDPTLPDAVDGWRLGYVVGTGGNASIYQAERQGQRAAVKVARRGNDDPRLVERALTEAKASSRVAHPNVLEVKGGGLLPDGRPYLVTELLEGEPLDLVLARRRSLPWPVAVAVLDDVAAALEATHSMGVVHRDLKPGNVFLARGGGAVRAKLLDFGLALLGAPGQQLAQTSASSVPGTPEYVSPEQARGEALDEKSDLYALGVVAFELLAGALPFSAPSGTGLLRLHAFVPAPPLAERAEVPEALSRLVDAMLQKDVSRRPATAAAVRAALARVRVPREPHDGLEGALLDSWLERERPRRSPWRRVLGALGLE